MQMMQVRSSDIDGEDHKCTYNGEDWGKREGLRSMSTSRLFAILHNVSHGIIMQRAIRDSTVDAPVSTVKLVPRMGRDGNISVIDERRKYTINRVHVR